MDIQLHYSEHGSGEPLVLLHGNGEDGTYFNRQIACFQDRFRVIAIDTRGHGGSPRGTAPFTLEQFARDLAGFMDEHDIDSAHLLGFSDGANIALLFALEHPNRVRSLVLNGGNLFPEGLTAQTREEIDNELREAQATDDERQLELVRLMIDEPHIDPAQLARLHMPTLVIAGTDDMIEEAHTRLIAESIPSAQLAIIEGTHFVASENPDAFNQVVGAFLSNLDNAESSFAGHPACGAVPAPFIVGITGGSGSGKTTFTERLRARLGKNAVMISHDDYYKHLPHMTQQEAKAYNFDSPDALDTNLLIAHLRTLKRGLPVDVPSYDFASFTRTEAARHIEPVSIILVEGLLIMCDPELLDLFDLVIFIDSDSDTRAIRRLVRDCHDRGANLERAVHMYLGTTKPAHERYIEPFKAKADIVIPDATNERALDIVEKGISELCSSH